jgi:uncharacterized protein (DUF362 family)
MSSLPNGSSGITRRGFLVGAGSGLVVGTPLAWLGLRAAQGIESRDGAHRLFTSRSVEVPKPEYAMPGPFPGRVVEVRHPGSVRPDHTICKEAVRAMMDRGMTELTGADHPQEAWKRFFETDDVVGVKVNPVGKRQRPGVVGVISSPEVLIEVVKGLKSAGVKARNILVFERYANEFRDAGYEKVMRERDLDGCRWYASSSGYDNTQLRIDGRGADGDHDPHVVGYDPDVFVHMGFADPEVERTRDSRRFRSHLSVLVTRMVNKIVTIPNLKDHRSAGVTMALKNLSHGLNNNVARSHISGINRLGNAVSGPNQCNTFIPTAVSHLPTRQKATLHVLDGLIGVYEGGPGSWNVTWGTWRRGSLFFATDPVAMDHVGWDIIDAKRAQEGWQPVAKMGLQHQSSAAVVSSRLAALAGQGTADMVALAAAGQNYPGSQEGEPFDRRQPEHVILAGTIGLGVFDARGIDHRVIRLPS